MRPPTAQVAGIARAAAPTVVAAILALALAACATRPSGAPTGSATENADYVGVFTGEYVDGMPLFRFPPIHVVGSRSSVAGVRVD